MAIVPTTILSNKRAAPNKLSAWNSGQKQLIAQCKFFSVYKYNVSSLNRMDMPTKRLLSPYYMNLVLSHTDKK